jgi:hypothetical protein
MRLRNVADAVGITERAVQKIVRELQEAGFIEVTKHGRCNRYAINTRKTLRHTLESKCPVGKLLQLFTIQGKRALKPAAAKITQAETPASAMPSATGRQPAPSAAMAEPDAARAKKKASGAKGKTAAQQKPMDDRQQGSLF